MLEIRLLGGFAAALNDGPLACRLGPKLQGLLALLASQRGRPICRGRLAGLLWGEHEPDSARHSLNQALTTVRGALGPDAADLLLSGPEGVRLAGHRLDADVQAFEAAVRDGRRDALEDAFRLYRGDFLEGLDLPEPAFEEWLLSERYRLNELATRAFTRLLDLQTASGDFDAALDTARRLVSLTPLEEAAHARLIELHGARGHRGLAEMQYKRCAEILHRELGEQPGEDVRTALREARRPSSGAARSLMVAPGAGGAKQPLGEPQRSGGWARRTLPVAAAAFLVLLGVLAWTFHDLTDERTAPGVADSWPLPAQPSIAVLPFNNLSGDPGQDYLVDGMARDIITDLSRFSTLFVTAASSSFRYKGKATSVRDVARDLGVRYVLEGSAGLHRDRFRLDASLIDATTSGHVWSQRYERPIGDVSATQKEISRDVASLVASDRGLLVQAEIERIARKPTSSLAAYELFQRGAHHRNLESRDDTRIAREQFQRAVEVDAGYARALASLALTHLDEVWGNWTHSPEASVREAKELARRATQVDASEPLGYMVLGLAYGIEARYGDAIALLEKARVLNPNDDHILHALAYNLFYSGIDPERGAALLTEVIRRNPLYPEVVLRDLAHAYIYLDRPRDALDALDRVARRHRPSYWLFKAASHARLDQTEAARAAIAEALKLDPNLTLEGEHERRLAMGLHPGQAEHLTGLLRTAGLPARATP